MTRADPRDHYGRIATAVASRSLGWALVQSGDVPGGVARLRLARGAIEPVVREDPANGYARDEVPAIDYYLGQALLRSRPPALRAEGCQTLARCRVAWETADRAGRLQANTRDALAEVRGLLARCAGAPPVR